MTMSDAAHYQEGLDRFNAGRFWDAHESWEEAWKIERDPVVRLFYKGIIQMAAALVHWQRGNPRGLHLNWAKARPKLVDCGSQQLGLPIKPLISLMDAFVAADGIDHIPPQLIILSADPDAG